MHPTRVRFVSTCIALLCAGVLLAPPALSLTGYRWYPIGPSPAPGLFPGQASGRVTSIAVNPNDQNDIWIGTAGGGVWHWDNVRQTWFAMSDNEASLAIGSIVLADCTPGSFCRTIYAGTGENALRRDTYYGAGLLIGTYDGTSVTWVLRNGFPPNPCTGSSACNNHYDFTHGSIYSVALDPNTSGASRVIYIALSSGSTASSSESTVTAPAPVGGYGIYKSADNGLTWTKIFFAGRPTDLEIDPAHPNVLFAGFTALGIFRSIDSGTTWCPLDPGVQQPTGCTVDTFLSPLPNPLTTTFDHVEIALDPAPNQAALHLYASFGMCPDRWDSPCEPGFFESFDGGSTWKKLLDGSTGFSLDGHIPRCPAAYSRYTHALTVSPAPADGSLLFAGGVHVCTYNHTIPFFLQSDTSTILVQGQTSIAHLDHHALVFPTADTTHMRVYDASDGGVAVSNDGGTTWTPMVNGLGVMEFQSLSDSSQVPDVYGGLQDNGSLDWDGAKSWTLFSSVADGGFSIMQPHGVVVSRYMTSSPVVYRSMDVNPLRSFNGANPFPFSSLPPQYDLGLNTTDLRSIYPPLVANPDETLFFGTRSLYRSGDEATDWSLISPALVSGDPLGAAFPGGGSFPDVDFLSAVATHPSLSSHIYTGSYTGILARTTAACTSAPCWPSPTTPPPRSPITRLAVDSSVKFKDTVYASLSGFFSGTHVYGSTDGGDTWTQTAAHPALDGLPVDTITIDPAGTVHNNLWIGTDKGVYRSDNAGASWYPFNIGLPNVPVYEIVIDGPRDRAFAATHGRGVYILTNPVIKHHVMIINGVLRVMSALGTGFNPNQRCVARVLRQDGSICAAGGSDALGGTLGTDADGFLVSTRAGVFSNVAMVSICAQGKCLNTDIANCTNPANPMATLETTCGPQIVSTPIDRSADNPDPPSSVFTLGGLSGGLGSGGTLEVLPAVQSVDGSTRLLCSVGVPFAGTDAPAAVLQRAGDAIDGDGMCQAAGVSADFIPPVLPDGGEDQFPKPAALKLEAPGVTGGELITGASLFPGQAGGVCLGVRNVGESSTPKLHGVRIRFTAPPPGAAGGSLTLTEETGLGPCEINVPIPAGSQPSAIAAAVAAAFQAPGIPGPNPACASNVNARDLTSHGDSVSVSLASAIDLCVSDGAIGATIVPQEICTSDTDCDDGNPCTLDACSPATGQCHYAPAPNGQPCDDANPCTIGNTCQSGVCGQPINCNDGNPCTTDSCNPATGACVNTAVACDDGNPCTADSCSPVTGGCVFAPMPGAACNDGNSCTIGDACVLTPGSPIPTCQGNPKCADGDPCTSDLCDPATGACLNQPIQCDDGNPCTTDACVGGTCVSSPIMGACSDGNLCTAGDTCVAGPTGAPSCTGAPVNCDDGNACTADACDPTTGGCTHSPVQWPDVSGLVFTGNTGLTWSADPGFPLYDTYRGTIPPHGQGSRPPLGAIYDQTCFETGDSHGDGALVSTDPAVPPAGTAFYYLVSVRSPCGDGPLGEDSNTTPVPNTSPCPAP